MAQDLGGFMKTIPPGSSVDEMFLMMNRKNRRVLESHARRVNERANLLFRQFKEAAPRLEVAQWNLSVSPKSEGSNADGPPRFAGMPGFGTRNAGSLHILYCNIKFGDHQSRVRVWSHMSDDIPEKIRRLMSDTRNVIGGNNARSLVSVRGDDGKWRYFASAAPVPTSPGKTRRGGTFFASTKPWSFLYVDDNDREEFLKARPEMYDVDPLTPGDAPKVQTAGMVDPNTFDSITQQIERTYQDSIVGMEKRARGAIALDQPYEVSKYRPVDPTDFSKGAKRVGDTLGYSTLGEPISFPSPTGRRGDINGWFVQIDPLAALRVDPQSSRLVRGCVASSRLFNVPGAVVDASGNRKYTADFSRRVRDIFTGVNNRTNGRGLFVAMDNNGELVIPLMKPSHFGKLEDSRLAQVMENNLSALRYLTSQASGEVDDSVVTEHLRQTLGIVYRDWAANREAFGGFPVLKIANTSTHSRLAPGNYTIYGAAEYLKAAVNFAVDNNPRDEAIYAPLVSQLDRNWHDEAENARRGEIAGVTASLMTASERVRDRLSSVVKLMNSALNISTNQEAYDYFSSPEWKQQWTVYGIKDKTTGMVLRNIMIPKDPSFNNTKFRELAKDLEADIEAKNRGGQKIELFVNNGFSFKEWAEAMDNPDSVRGRKGMLPPQQLMIKLNTVMPKGSADIGVIPSKDGTLEIGEITNLVQSLNHHGGANRVTYRSVFPVIDRQLSGGRDVSDPGIGRASGEVPGATVPGIDDVPSPVTAEQVNMRKYFHDQVKKVMYAMNEATQIINVGEELHNQMPQGVWVSTEDGAGSKKIRVVFDRAGNMYSMKNPLNNDLSADNLVLIAPQIYRSDSLYMKTLKGIAAIIGQNTGGKSGGLSWSDPDNNGIVVSVIDPSTGDGVAKSLNGDVLKIKMGSGEAKSFLDWHNNLVAHVNSLESQWKLQAQAILAFPWMMVTMGGGIEANAFAAKIMDMAFTPSDRRYNVEMRMLQKEVRSKGGVIAEENFKTFVEYLRNEYAKAVGFQRKIGEPVQVTIDKLQDRIGNQIRAINSLGQVISEDIRAADLHRLKGSLTAEQRQRLDGAKSWFSLIVDETYDFFKKTIYDPIMAAVNSTWNIIRVLASLPAKLPQIGEKIIGAGFHSAQMAMRIFMQLFWRRAVDDVFSDDEVYNEVPDIDEHGNPRTRWNPETHQQEVIMRQESTGKVSLQKVRDALHWGVSSALGVRQLKHGDISRLERFTGGRYGSGEAERQAWGADLAATAMRHMYGAQQMERMFTVADPTQISYNVEPSKSGGPSGTFYVDIPIRPGDDWTATHQELARNGASKDDAGAGVLRDWWNRNQFLLSPQSLIGKTMSGAEVRVDSPPISGVRFVSDQNGYPHVQIKYGMKKVFGDENARRIWDRAFIHRAKGARKKRMALMGDVLSAPTETFESDRRIHLISRLLGV